MPCLASFAMAPPTVSSLESCTTVDGGRASRNRRRLQPNSSRLAGSTSTTHEAGAGSGSRAAPVSSVAALTDGDGIPFPSFAGTFLGLSSRAPRRRSPIARLPFFFRGMRE
jgi:hypothetical protein